MLIVVLIWLAYGLGEHLPIAVTEHPEAPVVILKGLYAGEITYSLGIAFTKLVGSLTVLASMESSPKNGFRASAQLT